MRKQICTSHLVKISFQRLQSDPQNESRVGAHCLLLDLLSKTFFSEGDNPLK